jgi:hypothetical protein
MYGWDTCPPQRDTCLPAGRGLCPAEARGLGVRRSTLLVRPECASVTAHRYDTREADFSWHIVTLVEQLYRIRRYRIRARR